jgi:glycosyltransferase involved in cell wall biosynthesis
MKKTILFDLLNSQPSVKSKYHGGGEYIKTVFRQLLIEFHGSCEISVFYDKEKFMDEWVLDLISKYDVTTDDVRSYDQFKLWIQGKQFDIFYSGLPFTYKKEWFSDKIKIRGTVHGLRPIELPSDKYACKYGSIKRKSKEIIKYYINQMCDAVIKRNQRYYLNVLKMLDEICCSSEHTKYSILRNFPQLREKTINVYYPPLKYTNAHTDYSCAGIVPSSPYLLLLGGDRWLKNSYRALKAINNLYHNGYLREHKTVLVGKAPMSIQKEFGDENRFAFLDYVKPEELECLYKFCDLFIYPTLNEGFGYPPLEAMRYGKTCVVSAMCSVPEICGDAVYYVNPYDIGEMETRILYALDNKIDISKINARFDCIHKRQIDDLKKVCELIVS